MEHETLLGKLTRYKILETEKIIAPSLNKNTQTRKTKKQSKIKQNPIKQTFKILNNPHNLN